MATGGTSEKRRQSIGVKHVHLDFTSQEWPTKRDHLHEKVKQLDKAITAEHEMDLLRQTYIDCGLSIDFVLCTDDRLGGVPLPRDQGRALADMRLADLIGQQRNEIARLLDEITG
jgi:hypothetical protein